MSQKCFWLYYQFVFSILILSEVDLFFDKKSFEKKYKFLVLKWEKKRVGACNSPGDSFDWADSPKIKLWVVKLRNQNHSLRAELLTVSNQKIISQVGVQTLRKEIKKLKYKIIYADKMVQSLRIDARADLRG